jgi:hypothetical protein
MSTWVVPIVVCLLVGGFSFFMGWWSCRSNTKVGTPSASHNNARDAIATIIWGAVKEFDEKSTVNVNDYADQVLRYVATAPVA